jgi:hypothetical protein
MIATTRNRQKSCNTFPANAFVWVKTAGLPETRGEAGRKRTMFYLALFGTLAAVGALLAVARRQRETSSTSRPIRLDLK